MLRNEIAVCLLVLGTLLSSVGCAALVQSRRQATSTARTIQLIPIRDSENPEVVYSYVALEVESYLEILNKRAKERARDLRYFSKWSTTRHIGFFGTMTEYETKIGARMVIPW